jgi:hypothetical protein
MKEQPSSTTTTNTDHAFKNEGSNCNAQERWMKNYLRQNVGKRSLKCHQYSLPIGSAVSLHLKCQKKIKAYFPSYRRPEG